jgi:pilus assembly protein Flp/PilA
VKAYLADDRGATAVEYALLIGVLSLGVITAAGALSDKIYNVLSGLANTMETAAGGG